jgi:hypothetical protein
VTNNFICHDVSLGRNIAQHGQAQSKAQPWKNHNAPQENYFKVQSLWRASMKAIKAETVCNNLTRN